MEIIDHNLNIKVVPARDIKVLQTFCPACQKHFVVKFSDTMELNELEVAWVKDKLKKTLTTHKCLIDMRGNKITK